MIRYLFVYGTLMRAAARTQLGHEQRLRLESSGEWLGEARIDGRLYDLGRYPILAAPKARHETVFGEVYRLQTPATTFGWLDHYEGIPPGKTRGAEYERSTGPVRNAAGETIDAWVYIHIGPIGRARRIADGRWRPHQDNTGMP